MRKRPGRKLRIAALIAALLPLAASLVILAASLWVGKRTQPYIYDSLSETPYNRAGLLLGTSKYTLRGTINPFYQNRIDAAVALLEAGKIDYVIVSGDNREQNYNEPREMRRDLLANGIPKERIVADTAGIRTLNSVLRAKYVFGQDSITIISQGFHVERALFIALHHDLYAIGFAAAEVDWGYGYKTYVREYLARIRLLLDLFVFGTKPEFGDENSTV